VLENKEKSGCDINIIINFAVINYVYKLFRGTDFTLSVVIMMLKMLRKRIANVLQCH